MPYERKLEDKICTVLSRSLKINNVKRNITEHTGISAIVMECGNFHFFCDFFLIMKFNMVTTNLKWNNKKNVLMQNALLSFGVASGLQSACTELQQAGKSYLHRFLLCGQ